MESIINKGWWIDTGNLNDYLSANQIKITDLNNKEDSRIYKNVFFKGNSKIMDSEIIKYSSIGEDVIIEDSKVENCIILDGSKIKNYNLKNCLLSMNTVLINDEIDMKILENKII